VVQQPQCCQQLAGPDHDWCRVARTPAALPRCRAPAGWCRPPRRTPPPAPGCSPGCQSVVCAEGPHGGGSQEGVVSAHPAALSAVGHTHHVHAPCPLRWWLWTCRWQRRPAAARAPAQPAQQHTGWQAQHGVPGITGSAACRTHTHTHAPSGCGCRPGRCRRRCTGCC
jgi:hypothetical protein